MMDSNWWWCASASRGIFLLPLPHGHLGLRVVHVYHRIPTGKSHNRNAIAAMAKPHFSVGASQAHLPRQSLIRSGICPRKTPVAVLATQSPWITHMYCIHIEVVMVGVSN